MTETADNSSEKFDEEIISKTEKLTIDEKHESNWCDLAPETKLKCIENMDFEVRYQLRETARAENELVDSLRYKFDILYLYRKFFHLINRNPREDYDTRTFDSDEDCSFIYGMCNMKNVKFLPYVLRKCDIEKLDIGNKYLLDRIDFDKLDTVIKAKCFVLKYYQEIDNHDFSSTIRMFKSCWNNIEKISLEAPYHRISYEEFFAVPSVYNAKDLYIDTPAAKKEATPYITLIKKWIENDVQIGTRARNYRSKSTDRLFKEFQERATSRQEFSMRIKTDNPDKHILMISMRTKMNPFYCAVIPSGLPESQHLEHIESFSV